MITEDSNLSSSGSILLIEANKYRLAANQLKLITSLYKNKCCSPSVERLIKQFSIKNENAAHLFSMEK